MLVILDPRFSETPSFPFRMARASGMSGGLRPRCLRRTMGLAAYLVLTILGAWMIPALIEYASGLG